MRSNLIGPVRQVEVAIIKKLVDGYPGQAVKNAQKGLQCIVRETVK